MGSCYNTNFCRVIVDTEGNSPSQLPPKVGELIRSCSTGISRKQAEKMKHILAPTTP